MAESIIKLAWIQFDTFTLEQCWSPDLRFSLNSFVLFLILFPYHPFGNPASWASLDNAIVVLWTFMKNWHDKWVPDLFLIVLVAGLCITFVVVWLQCTSTYLTPEISKKMGGPRLQEPCRVCSDGVYVQVIQDGCSLALYTCPAGESMLYPHPTHKNVLGPLLQRCITTGNLIMSLPCLNDYDDLLLLTKGYISAVECIKPYTIQF